MTSYLTANKKHVIKYCTTVYKSNGKNLFWPFKNAGEIRNKLKSKGNLASSLSTLDFYTIYTTLLHLIKETLTELFGETAHFLKLLKRIVLFNNLNTMSCGHVR